MISFEGQVAIVTGAGGGIGRAHALELARRGASVVVNDLGCDTTGRGSSSEMADEVVAEILAAGGTAVANHASVATTEGANGMVEQAIDAFGKLDVLINNAGTMRTALIAEITDEDWDAVVATHLTGSFKLTRAAWPHMKAQGYGRIVYTASSAGLFGAPVIGSYAAAKAGVAGLMHQAALEGRDLGILCNAIMPNGLSRLAARAAQDWSEATEEEADLLPPEFGNSMNVEFNTPLAVYLASADCTSTQALYSQCLGRIARVFIGAGAGWQAHRQSAPRVEDVAEHWDQISDTTGEFSLPASAFDELEIVLSQDARQA